MPPEAKAGSWIASQWAATISSASGSPINNQYYGILWAQGETEALDSGVTSDEYEGGLKYLLLSVLGEDLTNYSALDRMPVVISGLGSITTAGGGDAESDAIRAAQGRFLDNAREPQVIGCQAYDLPLDDGIHYDRDGMESLGARLAQNILELMGEESWSRGPEISSWERTGTSVTVTIAHDGGTDFTPTTAIAGFRFTDDGTAITISAAVRTDATTVTLTLASTPSGVERLGYAYGKNPDNANILVDNSSLNLPLRHASDVATSAAATGGADAVLVSQGIHGIEAGIAA